jgi:hypothetical protein
MNTIKEFRELVKYRQTVKRVFKGTASEQEAIEVSNQDIIKFFHAQKAVRAYRRSVGFVKNLFGSFTDRDTGDYSGYSYSEYKLFGAFALKVGYGFSASSLEMSDGGHGYHHECHKWTVNPLLRKS